MIGPELQGALYGALTAANVAGDRIYDRVPSSPVFPYVTIGDSQVLDDGNTCSAGWEVIEDVHIWSRPANGSKAELKRLMAEVVPAVLGISSVPGFVVIAAEMETARTMRDSDGITEHAIISFRFILDPA